MENGIRCYAQDTGKGTGIHKTSVGMRIGNYITSIVNSSHEANLVSKILHFACVELLFVKLLTLIERFKFFL